MKLTIFKFRVLLPIVYVVLTILLVVGMVITIAEGPNPFGSLFWVSAPGFYLLDLINHVLPDTRTNIWIQLAFAMMVNIGIYFVAGYLIDYAIERCRRSKPSGSA